MAVQPVILWTDALVYLLVFAVFVFVIWTARREHLRAPWRQVFTNKLAMLSLIILSAYALVGLLDSIHYRLPDTVKISPNHDDHVVSLLDRLITPIGDRDEVSYSSPLATHSYNKTAKLKTDGTIVRDYSYLLNVPPYTKAQYWVIVRLQLMKAVLHTLALMIVLSCLITWFVSWRNDLDFKQFAKQILRDDTDMPWRLLIVSLTVVLFVVTLSLYLGQVFYVFGTDKVGHDVFYQAIKSVRTGLVIGTLTTLVMLPFALLLGTMAGFFGGWVDDAIQYIYTTLSSIPGILLVVAAIMSLQIYMANHPDWFATTIQRADARLLALCLILGVTSWTGLCRLLRGETLKLREMEYIQAAKALGVRSGRIITRHILPNVMHIVLIVVVLDFSGLVLAEAVLSYVGVGVDPATYSWGNMINSARLELAREPVVWWPLLTAFIFMFILVLAANLFADAVRDAFDPRVGDSG